MPNHANFAAAICIRQEKLQEFLRIFYHTNRISHSLLGSALGYSIDMSLDLPQLELSSSNPGDFIFNLKAWGLLTIPFNGRYERRYSKIAARISIGQNVNINNGDLLFGFDPARTSVLSLQTDVLEGGSFSPEVQALLSSEYFRGLVQLLLRNQLSALLSIMIPFSLGMLGDIATDPGTRVSSRAVNNTLLIGINSIIPGHITNGAPDLLTDFTSGMHIALAINPSVLDLMLSGVRQSVITSVNEQDATLNSLSFSAREGFIRISGNAEKSGGEVNFSVDAVPHLVRRGRHEEWTDEDNRIHSYTAPDREELWFEMSNPSVDVSRSWWTYLLEAVLSIITFGVGLAAAESWAGTITHNIEGGVTGSGGRTINSRNQQFFLPGISEPVIMMRLQRYECHPDGINIGILLTVNFPATRIIGQEHITIEELTSTSPEYSIRMPFGLFSSDPQLFIRWTVRRTTDNEIILNMDGRAYVSLSISLRSYAAEMSRNICETYIISVRVYRALGRDITDFYNGSMPLRIIDRLDRSHPYVRWSHEVYEPVVIAGNGGSRILSGYELQNRHSRIHRTACPGRCRMVTRFSNKVHTDASAPPALEYLNVLPFPHNREQIIANRRILCDYCFFGGPDKTVPLV